MKITLFGSGYVGLVTGACFADVGYHVVCVDTDEAKVALLKQGISPLFEPGLSELLQKNIAANRLSFTTDKALGVKHGDYLFIAVGTPSLETGEADLSAVFSVANTIGQFMEDEKIIINKSTVPVGTGDKVDALVAKQLQQRQQILPYEVVSNPEFLKEGAAIADFTHPDRIIVGAKSEKAKIAMCELYQPFNHDGDRFMSMDIRSAELTKYAANAMLATKISLMNELCNLAEKVGADIEKVRVGMGSDPRIGYHFIYPGCGYGGSCFPKDVKALINTAKEQDYAAPLLEAVDMVNNRQKKRLFDKVERYFKGQLSGKVVALWGLAFKPNTDDIREAPSLVLMQALWERGVKVQAYDPFAMEAVKNSVGLRLDLMLCEDPYAALEGADVLIIATEWPVFQTPDVEKIKQLLRYPVIFDGRNCYDPEQMKNNGITYYGMGRGDSIEKNENN